MSKRIKTLIYLISSLVLSIAVAVGSLFFVIYNIGDWGYSIDKYNGEYSGKIDSYLDVYKDIWNAATPEDMNIDKAYGYDSPISFNARKGSDFVSGFEYVPVWRKGTIYDSRVFRPIFNYLFTVDFRDYQYAPNPYFNGKLVNAVLGFGTVRYDSGEFDDGERNNVRYLLLECDGRVESFVNSVTFSKDESDLEYGTLEEKNVEAPFDGAKNGKYIESFNNNSLLSRVNGTLVDQDATIIGLNYGRPVSHKVICNRFISGNVLPFQYSLRMIFSQERTLYPNELSKNDGSFERVVECDDIEHYISNTSVSIKSPYELVKPYLTTYSFFKNETLGVTRRKYAGRGWESVICNSSWVHNKFYYATNYHIWEDGGAERYIKRAPLILKMQLISFGSAWKPYEIDYSGCLELSSVKTKFKTIINEKHRNLFR